MSRNKRVIHRCCFRLEKGKRAGRLCGDQVSRFCTERKYCCTHSMLLDNRRAMAYFASLAERDDEVLRNAEEPKA